MKKIFFFAAIAAVMVSCANEETIKVSEGKAISFNTFVGKGTRAEQEANSFTKFYVYGGYETAPNVFEGTIVNGEVGGTWSYNPLRYWEDNQTYRFAGYFTESETLPKAEFDYNPLSLSLTGYKASGSDDLVMAVSDDYTVTDGKAGPVALDFKHALSKVEFTISSTLDPNYSITLSDVKINSASNTGNVKFAGTAEWSQLGDPDESVNYPDLTTALKVNDNEAKATADPLVGFMIPQEIKDQTLTFTANVTGYGKDITKKVTVNLSSVEVEKWIVNNVYNYKLTLTYENLIFTPDPDDPDKKPEPIEFSGVTVSNWETPENSSEIESITVVETENQD